MKYASTLTMLLFTLATLGQSTTYKNNYGTNYIGGKTGNFNKSSIYWTITQIGNNYTIKTNVTSESFDVTFSNFDSANKLYIYKVVGTGSFDGSQVKIVMTNGKLSDYAKGFVSSLNLLAILLADNTGYMYKLNK